MSNTLTGDANNITIRTSCHCGAIRASVPRHPEYIYYCQCSICRRYGAGWGYYEAGEVKINKAADAQTKTYVWGDELNAFHFCDHCGCMMYWWPLHNSATTAGIGLNMQCVDNVGDLKWVEKKISYKEAITVRKGVYDENGPINSKSG